MEVVEVSKKEKIKKKKNVVIEAVEDFFHLRKDLVWNRILFAGSWHIIALYGILTFPIWRHKLTFLWMITTNIVFMFGTTAGVHRYWSHQSFKAKLPLRVILFLCYYGSGVVKLSHWVIMHRVHHKYTDTDADPHDSRRGFFFSHIGWAFIEKNPIVHKRIREENINDLKEDPLVQFGDKHYLLVTLMLCYILPTLVPVYFWNENWYWAIMSQVFIRYVMQIHYVSSINSFAHLWGSKPYNRNIYPVENKMVSFVTLGEGFHNYHHTFPWDYKAAEFGNDSLNFTTLLLDFFSKIGWAYDLKSPDKNLIKLTCERKGDGSHPIWNVKKSEYK